MPETETIVGPPDMSWTPTLLKIHFDTLLGEYDRRYAARFVASEQAVKDAFAAQEKAISAALSSAQAAVNKAEAAAERRFEGLNEFRATLADQQRLLMPRAESLALHAATQEKFEAAAANRLLMMPRAEATASLKGMQDRLDGLAQRLDRSEGRGNGLHAGWGYLVGAVGLFLTLLLIGGALVAFAR